MIVEGKEGRQSGAEASLSRDGQMPRLNLRLKMGALATSGGVAAYDAADVMLMAARTIVLSREALPVRMID